MEQQKTNIKSERRRTQIDLSTMVYGKVPPQAKDVEEIILGCIMMVPDAYDTVNTMLRPECFYVEAHQRIYKAIQGLAAKSQPIDILTVTEELRTREELEMVGGPYYVTKITNSVASSAHIEAHCRIVLQKFIKREIIRISGELIGDAYEDASDPFELLEEAEKQISGINSALSFGDMISIDNVLVKAITQINDWRNRQDKSEVTGIRTGTKRLDMLTRGWQPGDFIIIAARPSVGKTAFALKVLKAAADHVKERKGTVAFWSLEMVVVRIVLRMLASQSKVWLLKIQTGNLTDEDMRHIYATGVQVLSQLGIWFDDKPGLTIPKLKSKARKLKKKENLQLIIIDYLQLISSSNSKAIREQQVSEISRDIKSLALELNIPIIALSQLSREIEKRSDPEPQPSDLRESGSLEQDADTIIFLYDYSKAEKDENADLNNRRRVKVAKNRDGMLDIFDVKFEGTIQLFSEIEEIESHFPSGNWRPVSNVEKEKEEPEDDGPF